MYDVIRYINENIGKKLTLEGVAQNFGYSKWYFCEKFKSYTGVTFGTYMQSKRMQLAVSDLLRGEKILDIANDYGYEGPSGFNKAFFKQYDCYPSDFKRRARQHKTDYAERRKDMYSVSDRCEFLRNQAVNEKPHSRVICGQRAYYDLVGWLSLPEEKVNNSMLVANAVYTVAANCTPIIAEGELIVGYNFGDGDHEHMPKDDAAAAEVLREAGFHEPQIAWFLENRRHQYKLHRHFVNKDRIWGLRDEHGCAEWAKKGFCMKDNHTVIGYEEVLKYGFRGLLERIEKYEKRNGGCALYEAAKLMCQAGCQLGRRYAAHAQALAEAEQYEKRRQELLKIREVCKNVPENPARNFMEAIQSLWFAHILNTWEDGINANSLGRLDQILYPYYQKDIREGLLTKEDAFELICCLWIKLYRDYDVQQSCVGGCNEKGEDGVNELSYLMLDATEMLDFVRCLSAIPQKPPEPS